MRINTNRNAAALPLSPAAAQRYDATLKVTGVVGFALLTAAAAQVIVPIPGTPVPITLQTLAVLLAAVTLGPTLGAASMGLYLLLGLVGIPVYADFSGGLSVVFGATGGYLLGFILAQPVVNAALTGPDGNSAGWRGVMAGIVLGYATVFACGVPWLKLVTGVTWPEALAMGLWPFLPGALLKGAIAAAIGATLAPRRITRGW